MSTNPSPNKPNNRYPPPSRQPSPSTESRILSAWHSEWEAAETKTLITSMTTTQDLTTLAPGPGQSTSLLMQPADIDLANHEGMAGDLEMWFVGTEAEMPEGARAYVERIEKREAEEMEWQIKKAKGKQAVTEEDEEFPPEREEEMNEKDESASMQTTNKKKRSRSKGKKRGGMSQN